MIETHVVEVVVEAGDMVHNNKTLKIKWRSKASKVEDEVIREYSHLDMGITRTPMLQLSKIWTLCLRLLAQN